MSDIDKFKPQRLGKEKLYSIFEKVAMQSKCTVKRIEKVDENNPFDPYIICTNDGSSKKVHVYIKNISGAGWADKPEIKRIQIKKLPDLPMQRKDEFYILCGVCNYNNHSVIAVWDPWNYMTHNTCCSCYVYISSLEKAVCGGFFHGLNKGKEVMTCSEGHFCDLLREISSRYC